MKKYILLIIVCLTMGTKSFGQTNATDFTATDCNSVSHNLFTELNNGKIIVLVWIMPCATCISDAIAAYDAVQSFSASHPGKVKMYLIDDVGNATCVTLNNWATTNSIVPDAIFDNTGVLINENDYGGPGMPHVVVVGGIDHKIYYNVKDGSNNQVPITNAINNAISPTAIEEQTKPISELYVFPNPAIENLSVAYFLNKSEDVEISIVNVLGMKLNTFHFNQQQSGKQMFDIELDGNYKAGTYFLQINGNKIHQTIGFNVVK